MSNSMEDTLTGVKGTVESVKDAAQEKLGKVGEAAEGYYEEGVEQAKRLEEKVETYITDHPIRSLLIATGISLGAGLLIGRLIPR